MDQLRKTRSELNSVSLADPAAPWTAARRPPAFYAYWTDYLIDLQAAGCIVDVEATPAHRTQKVDSTRTMVDRVEDHFNLKPHRLVGETRPTAGAMVGWMVEGTGFHPARPSGIRVERKDRHSGARVLDPSRPTDTVSSRTSTC